MFRYKSSTDVMVLPTGGVPLKRNTEHAVSFKGLIDNVSVSLVRFCKTALIWILDHDKHCGFML